MKRKLSKFGFSDILICIVLGILIIICLIWVIQREFKEHEPIKIQAPLNIKEDTIPLNGLKNSSYVIKCAYQKELVDGHDYLIFHPTYKSLEQGYFVHDPECEKCKGKNNEK